VPDLKILTGGRPPKRIEMALALRDRLIQAIVAAMLVCAGATAHAADDPRKDPGSLSADAIEADVYFQQGNVIAAIPLYERLSKAQPDNPFYRTRLAFALMSQAKTTPTGRQRNALIKQARKEAERARALGDKSPLLDVILESVNRPDAGTHSYEARMNEAESAFTRGDMDTALAVYLEIAEANPSSYEAHLFAGDVYFRKRQMDLAAEWFAKAIQIEPDFETAYRYWGDALTAVGDMEGAKQKFVEAILAEPYGKRPWAGLRQWADRNGIVIEPPRITVPAAPTVKQKRGKPEITLNVDENMLNNPDAAAVWLTYSASRSTWRTDGFAERFPNEKVYRHSLPEEVEALQAAVAMLKSLELAEEKLDDNLRTLARLSDAGMLEPYVLLTAADNDIARDYASFRAVHRDQLRSYVVEHVLHPKPSADGGKEDKGQH
jgi:tetratricopeptide (TPR) repeat protein